MSREATRQSLNLHERIMFLFIVLTMPLMSAATDIYIPSMPHISSYFQANPSHVQFTVAAFLLGYAIMQITAGFIIDRIGRRKVYLAGLLGFVISNLAAAQASSIDGLLLARFIQGFSISMPVVAARTLLVDLFNDARLHRLSSYTASSWALGAIVAPWLGSHLQVYFDWQANFYFLALIGAAMLLFAIPFFKEPVYQKAHSFPAQWQGVKRIMNNQYFIAQAVAMSLAYGLMMCFHVIGPFLVQNVLGYSVTDYGLVSLGLGVSWLIGSSLNRMVQASVWTSTQTAVNMSFVLLGLSVMTLIVSLFYFNLWVLIIPVYVMLVACAMIFVNGISHSLSTLTEHKGVGSSMLGTINTLGVTVIAYLAAFLKTSHAIPMVIMFVFLSMSITYLIRIKPRAVRAFSLD